LKEAELAIKAVGKSNGFTYVVDTSTEIFVYLSDETTDILPLVKAHLNL
jgi:hypothetical protein